MNQTGLQRRGCRAAGPIVSGDPAVIADKIDDVVAAVNADTLLGIWAVSRLAAKVGVSVALSSSTEPAEIARDLGEHWADLVVQTTRENPESAHDVLRAAYGAFETVKEGASTSGA